MGRNAADGGTGRKPTGRRGAGETNAVSSRTLCFCGFWRSVVAKWPDAPWVLTRGSSSFKLVSEE